MICRAGWSVVEQRRAVSRANIRNETWRLGTANGEASRRIAERIAKFDQVVSCYLISGGYDLLVVVQGTSLREVASFVSEKLSTIDSVISTATLFRLKTYKENGALFTSETPEDRLSVSP